MNFWSSIRVSDVSLRKQFLQIYTVHRVNIFEEKVFNDTSYTVCSFLFTKKRFPPKKPIRFVIYPKKKIMNLLLDDSNDFTIGGELYKLPVIGKYKITRLTKANLEKQNTNLLIKCIDDNLKSKISMTYTKGEVYVDETPNCSARTYATLVINPKINEKKQKELSEKFNNFLEKQRTTYNSLFLTNYRESKDMARKRISFQLVYDIVSYLLENDPSV